MDEVRDPQRRRVLRGLGVLGGGVAAAGLMPGFARGALAMPALAGAGLLPSGAIDVHTHFFNASDASVVGYFIHSSNHGNPRLQRFLMKMEPLLTRLRRHAPSAAEELSQLREDDGGALAPLRISLRRGQIAEMLARGMRDEGLDKEFGSGNKGMHEVPLTAEEIRPLLEPDSDDGAAIAEKALVFGWDPAILRYFRFIGCMFQERWMNLREFRRGHEGRGMQAAFGAMVDFNYWYADHAISPLKDQIAVQSMLAKRSGGYMLPLVAYNPWTDALEDGAVLDEVIDAIEHRGFIGAKIYPPVGYLPAGNASTGASARRKPTPAQIEAHLEELFSACARLGAPVMAHANSTQGRDATNDQNSAPGGWKTLVAKLARRHQAPLVNLGHFGGDGADLVDGAPSDWTLEFSRLMDDAGGRGFYGDIGYWSGLRDCKGAGQCIAIQRLAAARDVNPVMADRVMYGSDWFMMIKEPDWKRWPTDIAGAVDRAGFDLGRLFHDNAIACFGLAPGGGNYRRVEAFLGGVPAWMA